MRILTILDEYVDFFLKVDICAVTGCSPGPGIRKRSPIWAFLTILEVLSLNGTEREIQNEA
jgi:hypothetical protein